MMMVAAVGGEMLRRGRYVVQHVSTVNNRRHVEEYEGRASMSP